MKTIFYKDFESEICQYELGNVLNTMSDSKYAVYENGDKLTDYYRPFGMQASTITGSGRGYRFGFNGMELENELTGTTGSHLDFGARIYDSRVGRWLSVDPLQKKYPGFSSYNYVLNSPIYLVDEDGRDVNLYTIKCISGCDWYSEDDYETKKVIGFTNEKMVKALQAFMATPEGYAYVALYANKGDNILGYSFDKSGELSSENLDFIAIDAGQSGAIGTTSGYYQNRSDKNSPDTKHFDLSYTLEKDQLFEKFDNKKYKLGVEISLYLNNDHSIEQFTHTIGHEAFIHAIKRNTFAAFQFTRGHYDNVREIYLKPSGPSGDYDHIDWRDNRQNYKIMNGFQKSLYDVKTLNLHQLNTIIKEHEGKYKNKTK